MARTKQKQIKYSKNVGIHNYERRVWRKNLKRIPVESRGHSLQRVLNENEARHIQHSHILPVNLSIIENPEEVITSFNEMESVISQGYPIYIDMKDVNRLSIESIMYMLSLMKNLKTRKVPFHIRGNVPATADNFHLLKNSGFFTFVGNNALVLRSNGETFSIHESASVEGDTVKNICQFIMQKMNIPQKSMYALYDMIIELMTNTVEHAYENGMNIVSHWYIYIDYDELKKEFHFAFLDNGLGIPTTVKKTSWEKFQKWVADKGILIYGQVDLIEASLLGAFRTRTQEENRGKGMPGIYEFLKKKKVNNLVIVSNNGYYSETKKIDMNATMRGTLYYWTMRKECFYASV